MKLVDLKDVLFSVHGHTQLGKLYNLTTSTILQEDCSVDYMVAHFGHLEVARITADDSYVIISVMLTEEQERDYIEV